MGNNKDRALKYCDLCETRVHQTWNLFYCYDCYQKLVKQRRKKLEVKKK
jgi:hypothetical protein